MNPINFFKQPEITDIHHLKCKDTIIEIPLLLLDLDEKNSNSHGCIYRVPSTLRSVNEAAYTPRMVSIGPFHHGNPKLMAMELVKDRFLMDLCGRVDTDLEILYRIINEERRKQLIDFYAGTFSPIDEFDKMVVTDAGFIIEFLLKIKHNEDNIITRKPLLRKCIECDLILLENQLPFFILDEIFKAATSNYPTTFTKLTRVFFDTIPHQKNSDCDASKSLKSKHFTDLVRHRLISNPGHEESKCSSNSYLQRKKYEDVSSVDETPESLRNAKKLEQAGIDFKPMKSMDLSAINFEKGRFLRYFPFLNLSWLVNCLCCCFDQRSVLKCKQPTLNLPVFKVTHWTECVLRNVMALEQCHYPNQTYVCDYVSFMDKLINTAEDVELLIEKKVIQNSLGSSEEVAQLLNKLCQYVEEQNQWFEKTVTKIMQHYKNPLNRVMTTLKIVYFKDFWRGTGTVVGVIVLGLTVYNVLIRRLL